MPDVSKLELSALAWHEVVHFRSAVKIQTFSQVFPLAGSIAKAFFRLFLWNFKEKNINHFLWHSHFYFRHSPKRRLWEMPDVSKPKLLALSWHEVVHFRSAVDIRPFSPVFPLAGSIAKVFFRLFLWNFKEKNINHFLWHSHFYFRHSPKRRLWEMPDVSKPKLLALSWHIVVLSLQYIENTNFLFVFPLADSMLG